MLCENIAFDINLKSYCVERRAQRIKITFKVQEWCASRIK